MVQIYIYKHNKKKNELLFCVAMKCWEWFIMFWRVTSDEICNAAFCASFYVIIYGIRSRLPTKNRNQCAILLSLMYTI